MTLQLAVRKGMMSNTQHKMTVRISKELHTEAKVKAVRLGVPLSAVVRELLQKWLEEGPPELEEEHWQEE